MVMEKGLVEEVGHPYTLYQQQGLFYELVSYTGEGAGEIVELARHSYEELVELDRN